MLSVEIWVCVFQIYCIDKYFFISHEKNTYIHVISLIDKASLCNMSPKRKNCTYLFWGLRVSGEIVDTICTVTPCCFSFTLFFIYKNLSLFLNGWLE